MTKGIESIGLSVNFIVFKICQTYNYTIRGRYENILNYPFYKYIAAVLCPINPQ